jgi:endothelin-converting enzyme/putative endopeptidase
MKKTATGSFFVIPALLGLTVTQAQTVQTVKEPGINVNYMDKTVKPNDFSDM